MRVKICKKYIKLKHNSMNIIAYRARKKIPKTYIQVPPELMCFEHCF
jgi:hypothetical protein